MKKLLSVLLIAAASTALFLGASVHAAPILITSAGDASLAGGSVYTFESDANETFTSKSFGAFSFSSSSGNLYIENTYSGSYSSTGQYLANQVSVGPFTISFASGVSAFGFNWGAADQPWTLDIFDTSNALLATLNIAAQTSANNYTGFIGANGNGANIGSAVLTTLSSYGYDYFLLDNVTLSNGNNVVPEPASLALLGIGLAGLAAMRRRKQIA